MCENMLDLGTMGNALGRNSTDDLFICFLGCGVHMNVFVVNAS